VGGHPYWYYVPYEADVQAALDKLRAREFAAGRYSPVIRFLEFQEPAFSAQNPGTRHKTIGAAIEAAAEDGTRSILDIAEVGRRPDLGVAAPPSAARLRELYGTDQPTRAMLDGHELFDEIERGQCLYVIAYDGGKPSEIFFAGYSYD
jgi:hypothetical protein